MQQCAGVQSTVQECARVETKKSNVLVYRVKKCAGVHSTAQPFASVHSKHVF